MKRNWCPSLDTNSNTRLDASHVGGNSDLGNQREDTPADYGAIAAHSDKSASRMAANVDSFAAGSSASKFSASVIASKFNKSLWPISFHTIPLEYLDDTNTKDGDVLALTEAFLESVVRNGQYVRRLALPVEHVGRFLDCVARHEASKHEHALSDNLEAMLILPSVSTGVSSHVVFDSFAGNENLAKRLETLVLSGIPCAEEETMVNFLSKYKRLTELSLVRCSLGATALPLLEAIKNRELEHINLECNDLGLSENEEQVRELLCELLQRNKFLLSLNLAHNNFSADAVEALMTALATSDTTLNPEDLPAEPEEEQPPIEDYLVHFGGEDDEEEEGEDEEPEEEEEAEEQNPPSDAEEEKEEEEKKKKKKKNTGEDGDGEEVEDDEGEEEEEEEEEEAEEDDDDEEDEEDEEGERKKKAKAKAKKDASKPKPPDEKEEKRRLEKIAKFYARQMKSTVREEAKARRALLSECTKDTRTVADYIETIRQAFQDEKKRKIADFCSRRSGWSAMEYLILRGNHVGDKGAAAVALTLRHEVALEEDEVARIDANLREKLSGLLEELQTRRAKTMLEERKERRRLTHMAAEAVASINKATAAMNRTGEEDEDEYSRDAPEVLMTNMDGEEANADGAPEAEGEEDAEGDVAPEFEMDVGGWALNIHPKKSGMNSLLYLDLGSCDVGSPGIKALATTLRDNKVLESIILRNNRFGAKFQKVAVDDGGSVAERRTEVPNFVSSGFKAFTEMLTVNATLLHLDLGYCSLQPDSIRLLAGALRENRTLATLCLEGNRIGQNIPSEEQNAGTTPSCLLGLLEAVQTSGVQHLNLSHNELERVLWQDELAALASVSKKIVSLYLNGVGLTGDHVRKWAEALCGDASALHVLHMARNSFQTEADGDALDLLLSQSPSLEELCLDDHGKLTSKAVGRALAHVPPSLTSISLNRVGVSGVLDTVSLKSLVYLSLSDVALHSPEQLAAWVKCIGEQCHSLRFLSLWSRRLHMEAMMDTCCALATAIETLQYADFGVMMRFDQQQDTVDALGEMERKFLTRRIESAAHQQDAEKIAAAQPS